MKSIPTMLTVIVLSLAIWAFFYEKNMPLGASDTALVVGVCLAVVLFGRWIWARIRNKAGKES